MEKTYWNKNIYQWVLPTYPPQKNKHPWKKFTISKNEYYGHNLNAWQKSKIVILKIIPLFLLSIALAPLTIPLFFSSGIYRKLGIWIREVHYSKSIKFIINIANNSIRSVSSSSKMNDSPFNVPNEVAMLFLSMPSLSNSKEARRYLQTLSCVSKSMQPFVEQTKINLINAGIISIGKLPGIDHDLDKALTYINSVKTQITNLDLTGLKLSAKEIETLLSDCHNLTSLHFGIFCKVTDKGLEKILKMNSLISLDLGSTKITDKDIEEISKLPSLTSLTLVGLEITDQGLEEVAKMKSLTSLSLWGTQITDNGLKEVSKMQSITSLTLANCRNITDTGMKEISKMKELISLNLRGTKITDRGLKEVSKLPSLTFLALGGTQISDKGLEEVTNLKSLTFLGLGNTKITDKGLKEVSKLKFLNSLNLWHCTKITDQGLEDIIKLKFLNSLNLWGCTNITGIGLDKVSKMKSLNQFRLQ